MSEETCIHAIPQAASCLHGVCIFCYRDRLGAARRRIAELEAAGRELIRTQAEAERTATEAALRWGWVNKTPDLEKYLKRGIAALLGEGKP